MWEKDKELLEMYRNCMKNLMTEIRDGEEIEWEDACSVESAKLQQYTFDMIYRYKSMNVSEISEKQASFYTPRVPFHQNIWFT